jgi:uncharacterized protein (UPF0261 family)
MISCGPLERRDKGDPLWVSRKLAERKLLVMDSARVEVRLIADEMKSLAYEVAQKLNRRKYKRMIKFLIPLKGFSSLGTEGGILHDPGSDRAFIESIKENLDPEIEIIEVDTHINSPEFAEVVVQVLRRTMPKQFS